MKTNFTKMEGALSEALHKLRVEKLLILADEASGKPLSSSETQMRLVFVKNLEFALKRLYHHDRDIYKKLGIKKKEFQPLLSDPVHLTKEAWEIIVQLKKKVDALLKELPPQESSDEELVEQQRKRHIKKRFNVSERWLPLT